MMPCGRLGAWGAFGSFGMSSSSTGRVPSGKKQIEVDVGRRRCAVIGNDEFYQMVEAERLTPSGVTVEIVLILINTTERNA